MDDRVIQPCRRRCTYKGITRYVRDRTGRMKTRPSNNFTRRKGLDHESEAIRAAASAAIVWTAQDQAKAVTGHDVFIRRLTATGRVCVESLTGSATEAVLFDRLWAELVAKPNDRFLRKLFTFIKQQDHYGWSDTWEKPAIEQRSSQMRWLQEIASSKRDGVSTVTDPQRKEQIRFHLMADAERADRAAAGLPLRKQRRAYIDGCTCLYCTTGVYEASAQEQSTVQSTQLI